MVKHSVIEGFCPLLNVMTCYFFYFTRCDADLLLATLCTRSIQTREGIIVMTLDCNAAVAGRDVLAKTVYARLFDWYTCGQCKINRH